MSGDLLRVEAEARAAEPEDAALLAPSEAAATAQPRSLRRWARPATAAACAAVLAVAALTGHARMPQRWLGSDLQGKQFLAMPAPGRLAVSPDCTMGPLPELWSAAEGSPLRLKVLSYNLFWWSLFDQGRPWMQRFYEHTTGNKATELIAQHSEQDPYDVMGFQECNDGAWLLKSAGLGSQYEVFRDRACCMAYRKATYQLLAKGVAYVAEDPKYGPRPAQWMRLKNLQTGAIVFFMNHHGPIPINSGGKCGAAAVGYNILQVIDSNARQGDAIVVVGDFNANAGSATIRSLQERLQKVAGGVVDGGIDYILSNLGAGAVLSTENLGHGGSDHEAIGAILQRGAAGPRRQPSAGQALPEPAAEPLAAEPKTAAGQVVDALV